MNTHEEKTAIGEVASDGTATDKEATDETHRAMAFVTTEEPRMLKDAIEKAELEGKSLQTPYCRKEATSQNSNRAGTSKSDGQESVIDATGGSSVLNETEGDEQRTKEASESNEQRQREGDRVAAIAVNNEILRVIQEQLQNISTQMDEFNREMNELASESKAKDEGLDRLEQRLKATEAQVESIKVQTTTAATDTKSAQLS